MERRDFLKSACAAGLCSCTVAGLLAGEEAKPGVSAPAAIPPSEDWRIAFGKQRYAKLVSLVAEKVDERTFGEIIEDLGRFCSGSGFAGKYVGDLDGYLAESRRRWGAQTEHDAEAGVVKISFQTPQGDCGCPLMGKGLVPAAACRCSVGAMRQALAVVSGRAVDVELKESVLQGGARCAFAIRIPKIAAMG
ncbi:MAG: hypothetical protein IPL39_14325 [Opitutaceae bacterium]|nr:hypothetical protein [Opitutaceae bacterium]